MRRLSGVALGTAAIVLAGAAAIPCEPARAAVSVSVNFGFNTFHDRLAVRGRWLRSPIWGEVWQPGHRYVGMDFQPYTNGYWQYTSEYGWYWVSYDPFDDVVYHYGRWVFDPDLGWLWVPGYTWGPGWVVWREGDGYTGWLPMPPDEMFISGSGLSLGMNFGSWGVSFYGYNRWYGNRVDPSRFWVFVDNRNLAARDYRRFVVPRERAKVLVANTRNVTRFEVVNNRVVNRSVDVKVIERASGRRIAPVAAKEVIKPNAIITTVDESNRIRQRERTQHPIRTDLFKGAGGNAKGGAAGATTGNQHGNATGGPGGTTTGGTQSPTQTGGAGAGNAMTGPSGASTSQTGAGQPTGPKGGKSSRGPLNPAGGMATSPSGSGAPMETGGSTSEKPKRERNSNTMTGGSMTGPTGGVTPQAGTTPAPGNTAPSTGAAPEEATRGPRNITPSDNTMSGPSGNVSSQPSGTKRRTANPGGTGMTGPAPGATPPGSAAPPSSGAPNTPDNNAPKKKNPKRNPPGTTPDSGTPQ